MFIIEKIEILFNVFVFGFNDKKAKNLNKIENKIFRFTE